MRHEFSYQITDGLMRAGTRRFILHHFGWRVPLATLVLLLLLIPVCGSSDDFVCGLFVGAIMLLYLLVAMSWVVGRLRGVQMARKLSTRTATCAITDEALELENALARAAIKWPLVQKVVRTREVWLFFLARHQYFSLPADKLAGAPGEFLASRVKAAGGKVI